MRKPWLLFATVLWSAGIAYASGENPWSSVSEPAPGPARAIGEYSAGCLQGAAALPLDGPGYQVMHPSRRRYYGHPDLVGFVRDLGRHMRADGMGVLLVGDLSQPRGGRASGGHSSHQSGLDVDVWYWHPPGARRGLAQESDRETLAARSVLDGKTGAVRAAWKERVARMLRLAAEDARVDRVFVHPIIKRELCARPDAERAYLRKIRPWHGHDDHFHARLACPKGSTACKPQAPVAEGDGCGEDLAWWFDEKAQADRKKAQRDYQRNVVEGRGWPTECEALLDPHRP